MKNIRIEKIAGMVHKGMIVADIGTDHAFLPVYLVKNGIVPKAYACDVAEGPLNSARNNISTAGLTDKIPAILSDGLQKVPEDTECIVIAGMGFETAKKILERYPERLKRFSQIIVEVNRDTIRMRQWISDHHFTIDDEIYIHEKKHDYIAISFSANDHSSYNEAEIIFGPVLICNNDPAYLDYLKGRNQKMERILEKSHGKSPAREQIKKEVDLYNQIFNQKKKDAVS